MSAFQSTVSDGQEVDWDGLGHGIQTNDDLAIDALRILCRDPKNAAKAIEFVPVLLTQCLEGRVSSLQALCNICYHEQAVRVKIVETEGALSRLCDNVRRLAEPTRLFTLRLLFLVTIEKGGYAHGLKDICYSLIEKGDECALYALRILYNIEDWITAEEHVDLVLVMASNQGYQMKIRGSAVNLLLKAKCKLTAGQSMQLLQDFGSAEREILLDYFPSTSGLIVKMIEEDDKLRGELRKRILPDLQSTPTKDMLVDRLRSPYPEIVMGSGDLMYALLRRNPARLLHHIGYGNAAGYIYMKGITRNSIRMPIEDDDLSSDEECIKQHGLHDSSIPDNATEMTEEEKETETVHLLDLLDRLEKTGIIRVVRE